MRNANIKDPLRGLSTRPINEDLSFGVDVGVASCGWAVIDVKNEQIVMTGVRAFDEAETAAARRMARGMRRNSHRSAQRMRQIRRLIRRYEIHPNPEPEALSATRGSNIDPVRFSVEGLRRELDSIEVATVLLYWAGHRGFQSNSKRDNKDTDNKKLLKALGESEKRLDGRTFSEFISDQHGDRRRNRKEEFLLTPKREWLRDEATRVIGFQRRLGAPWATSEFEEEYLGVAFDQRPLRSSAHLIGHCNFEPKHRRASRFSYSYEKFRLLQALQDRGAIRNPDGSIRVLTSTELESAVTNIGSHRGLTFARLRSTLGLDRNKQFVESEDESVDIVTRGTSGCTQGTYAVRKFVGEAMWRHLTNTPALLDRAIAMLSYGEGINEIRSSLASLDIGRDSVTKLMEGVESGVFDHFSGAGMISSKAARRLIPLMLSGHNYAESCEAVGYDHSKSPKADPDINSPAVKRALSEARKQVAVLIRKFGRPGHISVEMTRGKIMSSNARERHNQTNAKRQKDRDACREEWKELSDDENPSIGDVENYMLWKEQGGKCIFCESHISMDFLRDDLFELEHILPRSVSFDNSQSNRVLACTKCNREKRGRTPYQWFGHDAERWAKFKARAESPRIDNAKRNKLLMKNLANQEDFAARQLVDTGTVARRLLMDLKTLYPEMYSSGQRIDGVSGFDRISAIPGRITGMLRSSWMRRTGYKKDRRDDRHHALDAMVCATITSDRLPRMLAEVYRVAEEADQVRQRRTPEFPPPWRTFAEDCLSNLQSGWFVSRKENQRVRGALHDATFRQRRRMPDGSWAYLEWKLVGSLKDSDTKNILNEGVRKAVEDWRKTPRNQQSEGPRLPNGTVAKRVRVLSVNKGKKTARQINFREMGGNRERRQGGFVENADMVRVDVYQVKVAKQDGKYRRVAPGYYIVPVYPQHCYARAPHTPVQAIRGGKPECDWPAMEPGDFLFSLRKNDFIEFKKRDGSMVRGIYIRTNRNDGGIHVARPYSISGEHPKNGSATIQAGSFRKFHVDRLGNLHEIKREPWPGSNRE